MQLITPTSTHVSALSPRARVPPPLHRGRSGPGQDWLGSGASPRRAYSGSGSQAALRCIPSPLHMQLQQSQNSSPFGAARQAAPRHLTPTLRPAFPAQGEDIENRVLVGPPEGPMGLQATLREKGARPCLAEVAAGTALDAGEKDAFGYSASSMGCTEFACMHALLPWSEGSWPRPVLSACRSAIGRRSRGFRQAHFGHSSKNMNVMHTIKLLVCKHFARTQALTM